MMVELMDVGNVGLLVANQGGKLVFDFARIECTFKDRFSLGKACGGVVKAGDEVVVLIGRAIAGVCLGEVENFVSFGYAGIGHIE